MAGGYVSLESGRKTEAIDINVVILDIEIVYNASGLYDNTYRECIKREKEKPIYTQRKLIRSYLGWVWIRE